MKIFFAADCEGGCAFYRSFLPAKYLRPNFKTDYFPGFLPNDPRTDSSDVVILQRHMDPYFLDWVPKARAEGKIVIYDIDDSFWHLPPHNPVHRFYTKEKKEVVERIISSCDAVISSTEPLAGWVKRFNDNVIIVPNLVEVPTVSRKPFSNRIKIGWGGSITHVGDFDKTLTKALNHVYKKYDAHLIFLGYQPPQFKDRSEFVKPVQANHYLNQLYLADLDIAIAPVQKNFFNDCKSNLKYLEYGICGSAVVASNSFPYRDTIGKADSIGIIADNFMEPLIKLCEDDGYRTLVQDNAKDFVIKNYCWIPQREKVVKLYKFLLDGIVNSRGLDIKEQSSEE